MLQTRDNRHCTNTTHSHKMTINIAPKTRQSYQKEKKKKILLYKLLSFTQFLSMANTYTTQNILEVLTFCFFGEQFLLKLVLGPWGCPLRSSSQLLRAFSQNLTWGCPLQPAQLSSRQAFLNRPFPSLQCSKEEKLRYWSDKIGQQCTE